MTPLLAIILATCADDLCRPSCRYMAWSGSGVGIPLAPPRFPPGRQDGRGLRRCVAPVLAVIWADPAAGPDRCRTSAPRWRRWRLPHSTPTLQQANNCLTRTLRHVEGRDLVRRNVSALELRQEHESGHEASAGRAGDDAGPGCGCLSCSRMRRLAAA